MKPGDAVIAGIGATAFGKLPGVNTVSMNVEASRRALEDAGIEKGEVDALFVKYPTSGFEMMYGQKVAEALGIQPRIAGGWDQGGAANVTLIMYAAMAIEAGQCDVALVTFADNPKTGSRHVYEQAFGPAARHGFFGTPSGYAFIAQRHQQQYGTTSEQLGAVAVAARKHGAANPNAQLRKPIEIDDHQASPWIVEPLRRDDCCLISDGGAAVVVMSARRAREAGVPAPVSILGIGEGQTAWDVELRPELSESAATVSAATAFKMAGLRPSDIDVAELYDCFSIVPLQTLEDYGFCKKGEGGPWVEGGRIEIGGDLPVNTSGGLLSETGMPGMQLIQEAVRQVRGTAVTQVPEAKKAIVSNQGGIMHTHATLIVGS